MADIPQTLSSWSTTAASNQPDNTDAVGPNTLADNLRVIQAVVAGVSNGTQALSTPALGTPASGTLTNATGLPISTGVSGLGTGVATALAVNVGSAGSPVVNGGALGTPSSGTLTNCTGLPVSTGISGLGTGVATFLATPSSANLASAVTGETGSGALMFGTSPTVTTSLVAGSASFDLANTTATTLNIGGAATTLSVASTTAAATHNYSCGATINGETKLINIGTNGVAGSLTSIGIGTGTGGIRTITIGNTTASGETTILSPTFQASYASVYLGDLVTTGGTYNFGGGVTSTGNTKTVDIGTGGDTGSTTNITLGSTAGGTTTLNAPTTKILGNLMLGSGTPSAQLHIIGTDTTDQVIIENTDASAVGAPDLVLYRNSASPAASDLISNVVFRGNTSTGALAQYASIAARIDDPTNANPDGALIIQTTAAGTLRNVATFTADVVSVLGSSLIEASTAIPAGGTAGLGYKFSSTSNFGIFFGSGAPTLSAAQGSLYLRSDGSSTSTRLYVNTNGTTGWTNVTTAA